MQCERLRRLCRSWGDQIVEDALAPARMLEFVERHMRSCEVCLTDESVSTESSRLRKLLVSFISIRDPQKAARFEEILEAQAGSEPEPEFEEEEAPEHEERDTEDEEVDI